MIKNILKKLLPRPITNILQKIKQNTIDQYRKKKLAKKMAGKHLTLLENLKNRSKIRVVFLAIHKNVWKVDPVFKKMLDDPYFDPVILVCPYTVYGEERMWKDMEEAYQYFSGKSYPVVSSYNKDSDQWITLDELNTDIVFFTNPHNLTRREYYEDAYKNYPSCYVPYHHEVGSYSDDLDQYGRSFHAALWRFYASHKYAKKQFLNLNPTKYENTKLFGYPYTSELLSQSNEKNSSSWKSKDLRKRIIWAPHHSIDMPNLPYSNFLIYAELMKKLAIQYKKYAVWCFKPHPILKSKLYAHSSWGKARTEEYFSFWKNQDFTQLNTSEYIDLFKLSDAMIHDCGSFLAEYLYLQKPVLYLMSPENDKSFYNEFGLKALDSCIIGHNSSDIEKFIKDVISENIYIKDSHIDFYNNELMSPLSNSFSPADKIISDIKKALKQ